jgi:uncharacterized protein (DUF2236 family)
MTAADQDRYFGEMDTIATKLGGNPVPHNSRDAHRIIQAFRHELVCDARTQEMAQRAELEAWLKRHRHKGVQMARGSRQRYELAA